MIRAAVIAAVALMGPVACVEPETPEEKAQRVADEINALCDGAYGKATKAADECRFREFRDIDPARLP